MPEAEELLIDAARHATVAVRAAWRRRRRPPPAAVLELAEAKPCLELLLEAVLGARWPIRTAQAPAPESWLRRLLRRDVARRAEAGVLPGDDGSAIYLPPSLPLQRGSAAALDEYCLLALLHGIRCQRGSAVASRAAAGALAGDLYLLAEGAAADRQLRRLLPGWKPALDALHARVAASLAGRRPAGGQAAEVAALYGAFLAGEANPLPVAAAPEGSLAWAAAYAGALHARHPRERYRPWLADPVLGPFLPPEAGPGSSRRLPPPVADAAGGPAAAALARRPRVRARGEDEDDAAPGMWMIQTAEPHPHAEDPFGLNRPQDRDGDGDARGAADSLAELEEASLIHGPGRAREVLYAADPPPRREGREAAAPAAAAFVYPEWDWEAGCYRDAAVRLRAALPREGDDGWSAAVLKRHAGMLAEMRRRLGAIRPAREPLRRQLEGDDIDCDAVVAERSELRAGVAPAGAFYQSRRAAPRRLGLLILLDASGSTEARIAGGTRVIDVEKEAALVAAAALAAVGVEFAMQAFSGEGAAAVQVREIKAFGAPWGAAAERRLAGLEPDRYTRLGAALRHAGMLLAGHRVDHRLLLLLSDGRPNDCDRYASRYGLEDSRQALAEAQLQRISPYCLTVDRAGSAYLPRLFGAGRYTVVRHPGQLPLALMTWLRQTARRCRR